MSNFETSKFLLDFLRANAGRQFKSIDLARELIAAHPLEAERKRSLSANDLSGVNLIIQVQAEISSRRSFLLKKYPEFTSTNSRPSLYSWSIDNSNVSRGPKEPFNEVVVREYALYQKLAVFLEGSGVQAMRIDEKTSSGKRGAGSNHWRHPDLAAIQYLPTDWEAKTQALGKHYQSSLMKFWSFEVKLSLSLSNVREAFFQTVSNSSWANFAFLAAGSIDARAREELELLSATHGVGVVQLNQSEPVESEIIIPAQERYSLDWRSIDRLVSENRDFARFIEFSSLVADAKTVQVAIPEFQRSFSNQG